MRSQHATQTASGLPTDDAGKMQAKIVIVEEVERLRWHIWNGKAKNAKRSIDRVRKVMHAYKEERGHNMRTAPSHRLWHGLLDVDGYLISEARVVGSSTTPSGTVPICASDLRSPREPQTFSSIGGMSRGICHSPSQIGSFCRADHILKRMKVRIIGTQVIDSRRLARFAGS